MSNITIDVYVGGDTQTGKKYENCAVLPFDMEEVLDATLDTAAITLQRTEEEVYEPLEEITLVVKDSYGGKLTTTWLVASDSSEEAIPGSGLFNHHLTLIEQTKWLEGFICDDLTVTHKGGNVYTENAQPVVPEETAS